MMQQQIEDKYFKALSARSLDVRTQELSTFDHTNFDAIVIFASQQKPADASTSEPESISFETNKKILLDTTPQEISALGIRECIVEEIKRLGFSASEGEVIKVLHPNKQTKLIVSGIGESAALPCPKRRAEAIRRASGVAMQTVHNLENIAICIGSADAFSAKDSKDTRIDCAFVGASLSLYSFELYKSTKTKNTKHTLTVVSKDALQHEDHLRELNTIQAAVKFARDLGNFPSCHLTPQNFITFTQRALKDDSLHLEVWDEERLKAERCGGILAVGKGSRNRPYLLKLKYTHPEAKRTLALVGKGITFDTGGLSLKPATSMTAMKFDMCGAADVVAVMQAVSRLNLAVNIVGFCCLAENMPSSSALKPDDIITIRGGKTVEIANTDAEGRLVLADGIVLACEENPDFLIDIATLTGAAVSALGERTIGVMTNKKKAATEFADIAAFEGEPAVYLPIPEEIPPLLKSTVADIINIQYSNRYAGMQFAAAFLREFLGSHPDGTQIDWIHLDIAGPSANTKSAYGYIPQGATGVSVRSIIAFAKKLN